MSGIITHTTTGLLSLLSRLPSVIGSELGEQAFFELAMAGYLHDLGKAMMPMEVLNKPSGLDEHEWEEARKHPVHAYELLRDTPGVPEKVVRAIYEHHERNDGSGYPRGLVRRKSGSVWKDSCGL